MGYNKEITQLIVECWGKGLTAEETVKAIEQVKNITLGIATVYRHRHSLTAQEMIKELQRQQQRDIAKCENPSTRMNYRDKLLDKLLPHKIEAEVKGTPKFQVEIVDNTSKKDTVSTSS